jgi:DNA-binding PadR family transcriptional regulator
MAKRDYLSDFEQLVLLSVLRLGQGAHGAAIRRDLEETAHRSVSVASIYVALSRLEQKGLARSWMSDPMPVRGGKARKHYELEADGIRALREGKEVLERMWAGVGRALDAAET